MVYKRDISTCSLIFHGYYFVFTCLGGPLGWIIAGTTMAAATALTIAKSELENDLKELTEEYLKTMDERLVKIVEQNEIDLDSETADFFMTRLTKVSLSKFSMCTKKFGKIFS